MKAKLTNGVELIELEGTSEELLKFYTELKKNQSTPWYYWNVPPVTITPTICLHEFDYSSTFPVCKKCGIYTYNLFVVDPNMPTYPINPLSPFYCTTTASLD